MNKTVFGINSYFTANRDVVMFIKGTSSDLQSEIFKFASKEGSRIQTGRRNPYVDSSVPRRFLVLTYFGELRER
jgi:hypothetical protein